MNRLNLNFALTTNEERAQFISEYIKQKQFQIRPPSEEELETMGNYILWGKDPTTGLNPKQDKTIELESRAKTWDSKEIESLDALAESPTFRESQLQEINGPKFKYPKINFSRAEARKNAPPHILKTLEIIWQQIDSLDLIINYYDLAHNKRKKPPRQELLDLFTPAQQDQLKEQSTHLNQFKYLKMRHLLVELRREQFTLKDTYSSPILRRTIDSFSEPPTTFFDADIIVLPFGLTSDSPLNKKIFNPDRFPNPSDFSESELQIISDKLWTQYDLSKPYFDFRELEHIYNAFILYEDIEDSTYKSSAESTLPFFLETLQFYANRANLSSLQQDILQLKIQKYKNQDIANLINARYQKTYNANYISTIFRQKILFQINNAAKLHLEILQNIFFPENFKTCKDCGEVLLLCPENFIRKAKSKDGFSVRCKKCDKELRLRRDSK